MANIWENSVITNKGLALQAKIMVGEPIKITSVKTGAGNVAASQLRNQTAVSKIKQTAEIQDMWIDDTYTAIIAVLLRNTGLTEAYDLYQIGFYATDPEEGEILYALAQTSQARHVPTEKEMPNYYLNWNFHFSLSNDIVLEPVINPAGLVTIELLDQKLTGYATKEDMKDMGLGEVSKYDILPVSKGGTGKTSIAETKVAFGIDKVPNVATNDQTPTYTESNSLAKLTSGEKLHAAMAKIAKAVTDLISHIGNKSNPHGVTKNQVGLGNVENKNSYTIRSELTKENVTSALGYTPPQTDTKYTHPASGVSAGTYKSVTVDKNGHVTGGSNPNTLAGFGITDGVTSGDFNSHKGSQSNPHGVTKAQVGLGNVPNVATNDQTPTYSDTTTLATLVSGEKLNVALQKIKFAITSLINHLNNKSNPHGVTKSQLGLGNVENKSSATIRGELTKANVTDALGYTPPQSDTSYSHPKSGVTASTYRSVTVDEYGHVTKGSNPTTLAGYGITDGASSEALSTHTGSKSNPHGVTKGQVGLGNVPNVATNDQTPTYSDTSTLATLSSGEKISVAFPKIKLAITNLISHLSNKSNPHGVTKAQVDLGNVPNVSTNDQTPTYSDTTTLATLSSGEKLNVAFQKIKYAITCLINHLNNKSNPHGVTKSQLGLGSVENKSSATIRGELTSANVTNALGYTPMKSGADYQELDMTQVDGSSFNISDCNARYFPVLNMVYVCADVWFGSGLSKGTSMSLFDISTQGPKHPTALAACLFDSGNGEVEAKITRERSGSTYKYRVSVTALEDISSSSNVLISGWYIVG